MSRRSRSGGLNTAAAHDTIIYVEGNLNSAGHRYVSGDFPQNLIETAKADGADLVLFGHLHIRMDRYADGIHLFNPGSAAQPRDQFAPSYGLVDIMESGILTAHGELQRTPAPFDDMFGF